jgi:FAD/FMN-containing dehydrogenase
VPVLQNSQLSRRRFLIASAAAAVGAGISPGLGISEALAQARIASPSDLALRQLAKSLAGPLLRPTDFDFAKYVMPYNLRYAGNLPQAVALCASPKDVAAAILWCRELDLPFAARSGGHSYAGYSTTNGLLIDLTLMASASFDPARKIVRAGGGARNQNLYDTLEKGDAAMTHGRCGTVGAAGFLLGGGIGFNMRGNGLACDQLIETEIVTADGSILTLNERSNTDLFWACRGGGGGNFGINTAFVLQAFATEPVTVFQLTWTSRPEEVFAALMPALDAAPENLGSRVSLAAVTPARRAAGQDVVVHLLGQLRGRDKQPELARILAPVYALASPQEIEVKELSYWDGQRFLEENDPPDYFQERSTFITRPLGGNAIGVAFDHLRRWPGTSAAADLRFFQTGGRINGVAPDATAFVHRDSHFIMDVGLDWNAQDTPGVVAENLAWLDGFYQAVLPFSTGGAYQNFIDPSLANWQDAYYGANLARLKRIKAAVDPRRLFHFAQAIPSA